MESGKDNVCFQELPVFRMYEVVAFVSIHSFSGAVNQTGRTEAQYSIILGKKEL